MDREWLSLQTRFAARVSWAVLQEDQHRHLFLQLECRDILANEAGAV
jgi:hypothetical protein